MRAVRAQIWEGFVTENALTRWMTVREAASYARCSAVTITREARKLRLRGYKLARRREWRFTADAVDRWLMDSREPRPYILDSDEWSVR